MNLTSGKMLHDGFLEISRDAVDYFAQWTYDSPLIVTPETNQRMHNIQKLLYKSIRHFVENYDKYRYIMPVSEAKNKILELYQDTPYRTGTYRTDFVIDINNHIKLIEITCRFALNGFFISGFFNLMADRYIEENPGFNKLDEYSAYYDYLIKYFGEFDHICILKGKDNKNETKYSVAVFEKAGYKVHVIPTDSITENLHLLRRAAVISELDHDELCSLPTETIKTIINSRLLNDLRTVLLIHDKRFFGVLNNQSFLQDALTDQENDEFRQYLVPTHMWNEENRKIWINAKNNKDQWIIKPCVLGKSINVYGGPTTSEEEWRGLFQEDKLSGMILQTYIEQRKFKGNIKDKQYEDYAVGTLLFFDDNFFGPGLFRASSHPITNVVDDRKLFPLVTEDDHIADKDLTI